jgi:hypothetical protein
MMAGPAMAQDRQDIDDFDSGVVRDFDGDRDEFCEDYPTGDCLLIIAETFGPVCEDEVPNLGYEVRLGPGVQGETVDVTFLNPDGPDASYEAQPLRGEILWPGARLGSDGEVDWPGWSLTDQGWILTDVEGLTFAAAGVEVLFEVNPTTFIRVAAADLTADPCDDAPEVIDTSLTRDPPAVAADGAAGAADDGVQVLGVTLALTGGNVALLAVLAAVLVGAGFMLLRVRRRTDGA